MHNDKLSDNHALSVKSHENRKRLVGKTISTQRIPNKNEEKAVAD